MIVSDLSADVVFISTKAPVEILIMLFGRRFCSDTLNGTHFARDPL